MFDLFFKTHKKNCFSLVKKNLILDKVVPNLYFLENIQKVYNNKELSLYLAKYLTFWLTQENLDGPYFLDYFQNYHRSDSWGATCFDVFHFGSLFSHTELAEMNDLPEERTEIAIMHILGEQVKFKKINHFFNFITLLKEAVRSDLIPLEEAVNDFYVIEVCKLIPYYQLTNFPKKVIEIISYGSEAGAEFGFFHIDFDKTLAYQTSKRDKTKKNENLEKVLKDFLYFVKILEININYDEENLKMFYKNLSDIKTNLTLKNIHTSNVPDGICMSNSDYILYIDSFLKILDNHFKPRFKFSLKKIVFLPKLIESLKKKFIKKMVFLIKTGKIFPLLGLFSIYIFLQISFFMFFKIFITFLFFVNVKKEMNKRNFPNIKAYFFDLRKNFFSRLNFKTFINLFVFFRLIFGLFFLDWDNLKTPTNDFVCYMLSARNNLEKRSIFLGQTLGLITSTQHNVQPGILETTIGLKRSCPSFNKYFAYTNNVITISRNDFYLSFLQGNRNSFLRATMLFPDSLAKNFSSKSTPNLIYPSLITAESGKEIMGAQEVSESIIPYYIGQIDDHNLKPNSSMIFELNIKNPAHPIKVEGEMILNNTIIEVKNFDTEKLLNVKARGYNSYIFYDPEPMTKDFKNDRYTLAKALKFLALNKGYHYCLVLDITNIELSSIEKEEIISNFKIFLMKHHKITFDHGEQKLHLEFIERIEKPIVLKTRVTEAILNSNSLDKVLVRFNQFLEQVDHLPVFEQSKRIQDLIPSFQQEIAESDVMQMDFKPEIHRDPFKCLTVQPFEDRRGLTKFQKAESSKVLAVIQEGNKLYDNRLIEFAENSVEKPMKRVYKLPYEISATGEKIESVSTFIPTTDKQIVPYDPIFAENQKKKNIKK